MEIDPNVARLESLHAQVRGVRAMLPQMVHRLAFVGDNSDSSALFHSVAQDLSEWRAAVVGLEEQYSELKALIDEAKSQNA